MSQGAIKQCVVCGELCANKPRVKDKQGRYLCKPCHDKLEAQYKPPTGAYDVEPVVDKPTRLNPDGCRCPGCGADIPAKGVLCVACGYSLATGAVVSPTNEIPEGPNTRDLWREEDSRSARRMAYLVPGITAIISLFAMMILYHDPSDPSVLGLGMAFFGVELVVGLIIFLICCYAFIGFDQPIHLLALQLAATYAANNAINAVIPFGMLSWPGLVMYLVIYAALLKWLTDIDFAEAMIVAAITTIFVAAVQFSLAAMFL